MTTLPRQTSAERFFMMESGERGQVLQQHLTAAERVFAKDTGRDHRYFGVEAATYYCEWLLLLEPEHAKEFLAALAAMHGTRDKAKYEATVVRFKLAKMALHVALAARDNTTSRGAA